ncbi:hypothetical protein [Vandammella animalimorsus]|uniref:hypothetical protein n=1 Tax=Vandammella animalimorsus TaxID=2029117 RepID=UPI0011C35B64|nr:hypothetical protein [Vandammella animalimorsus]
MAAWVLEALAAMDCVAASIPKNGGPNAETHIAAASRPPRPLVDTMYIMSNIKWMNPSSIQGQRPGLPSPSPSPFFGGMACVAEHPADHSSIQLARRTDACLLCVQHKRLASRSQLHI